jgi:hypothetical protein
VGLVEQRAGGDRRARTRRSHAAGAPGRQARRAVRRRRHRAAGRRAVHRDPRPPAGESLGLDVAVAADDGGRRRNHADGVRASSCG